MILNDKEITELCVQEPKMIAPFSPKQISYTENGAKAISYGVSSYGYDIRLAGQVKVFHNTSSGIVDPKKFDANSVTFDLEVKTDEEGCRYVLLPGNNYALSSSVEWFNIPPDMQVVAVGKSTYARSGISINVTPLEAGWSGELVIEIANHTPAPVKLYIDEGICQLLFFRGNPCETTYADRKGKYQGQKGITLAKV